MNFKHKAFFVGLAFFLFLTSWAFAGYDEGVAKFKNNDYAGALKEWQPLADQDDPMAANAVGALYDRGLGVPEDDKEAAKWYEKAAQAGLPLAMRNLANLYARGQGVSYDMNQARYWLEKASAAGDKAAIKRLAQINHTPLPPEEAPEQPATPVPVSVTPPPLPSTPPPAPVVTASSSVSGNTKQPPQGTVLNLPDKPVQPAPPPNGPIGPAVKAVPVPKVQETALPAADPASSKSSTPEAQPVQVASAEQPSPPSPDSNPALPSNKPDEQQSNPNADATSAPASDNWLLGQWEGPTLGCPPNGGIEFSDNATGSYFNGRLAVKLKAEYNIEGELITVTTLGVDGSKQSYVYKRTAPDRFVIEKIPQSMPASLIGVEHKKCAA